MRANSRTRTTKLVLPILAGGISLLAGCGGNTEEGGGQHPDVLLMVIDTLRADRLGCYGYERGTTPTIDALAARGAVFRRASAQAPWTLPSMTSIMTGRYLTAHRDMPDPKAPTLAETFKAAGYATVGVVANGLLLGDAGFGRGFDHYLLKESKDEERRKARFEDLLGWLEEPLAEALETDESGERKPLFVYVHAIDPHTPYRRVKRYDRDLPLGLSPPILPEGWQTETLERLGPPPAEDDPDWATALRRIKRQRGAYDHDVRYTDEVFGRLLAQLAELGVGENLLVAIVADHGEGLWENLAPRSVEQMRETPPEQLFFQTHGYNLSEQALRTPFVLAGPGVPEGAQFDEAVENVDLFPTLVNLCGLRTKADLHGIDLVPLMQGRADAEEWRTETYGFVNHAVTIRDETNGMKLVLPTPYGIEKRIIEPQLFDLRADPLERTNLFRSRPAEALRLEERAKAFLRRYPTTESRLNAHQADLARGMGYVGDLIGDDEDTEGDEHE